MKNIIKIILTSILVITLTNIGFGQTTQEWVRFNDQPDSRNKLNASITDKEGNTYLTGSSQELNGNLTSENFLTLKYDKDGNLLWAKTYDSGEGGHDESYAIALDKEGNVYVTGYATSATLELEEFYTIKYSSDGDEIWHAIFNGPETGGIKWNDHAKYIFVDDDLNVYVVGEVQAIDDSTYYIHVNIGVVKYNSSGELVYSGVYDTPTHGDEVPRSIAVNKFGHLFVAGNMNPQNEESANDMLFLMYDNHGNLRWDIQYNGPNSEGDEALLVTTDKYGNAYFAGYQRQETNGGEADLYIAKYDTTGAIVWDDVINSQISGINPNTHFPVAVAIDDNDNLYIDAYNSGFEYFLTKYDLSGSRKWISFWDGAIGIYKPGNIVFDSEDNIYLMGDNNPPDSLMNGAVLGAAKFSPQGNELWEFLYEDGIVDDAGSWTNEPIGIGIEKNNAIYLAGRGGSGGGWKAFELVKFSQSINEVNEDEIQPARFGLEQNYPNPFNPSTTINFTLDKREYVELAVYNSLGQLVTKLVNGERSAGKYQIVFNASNLSSGIYFYNLFAGNKIICRKCILIK